MAYSGPSFLIPPRPRDSPPPPGGSSETVVIGVGVAAIGAALLYLHDRNRGRSSIVHFPNVRHSKL